MTDDTEQNSARDPEVPEKAARRRFDEAYKRRILEEADRCTQPGQLGELLRREGLYSSLLSAWRRQREQGVLQALRPAAIALDGCSPSAKAPTCKRRRESVAGGGEKVRHRDQIKSRRVAGVHSPLIPFACGSSLFQAAL